MSYLIGMGDIVWRYIKEQTNEQRHRYALFFIYGVYILYEYAPDYWPSYCNTYCRSMHPLDQLTVVTGFRQRFDSLQK